MEFQAIVMTDPQLAQDRPSAANWRRGCRSWRLSPVFRQRHLLSALPLAPEVLDSLLEAGLKLNLGPPTEFTDRERNVRLALFRIVAGQSLADNL